MDNLFDEAIENGAPQRSEKEVYKLNEMLFKSTNEQLTTDYLHWWSAAFEAALSLYNDAKLDGSPNSVRMRMLAASRCAQLCAAGLGFFGAAVEVLKDGPADIEAATAVARVTTLAVENKVEQWLKAAQLAQN